MYFVCWVDSSGGGGGWSDLFSWKKKSFGLAESDAFDLDGGFVAVVVEMEADDLKLG